MKKDLVELVFILDRSGSMGHLTEDTIGGFNSLIEKQKAEEGDAFVTTVLFDDQYDILHDHVNIKDVQPITKKEYFARGMTALLDAIGRTINMIGKRLSETAEEDRPEKVVVVITTDGLENASKEFKRDVVKSMIEEQQTKYSWTFMFLGANMDAVAEAGALGIDQRFARTYTTNSAGVESVYCATASAMSVARSAKKYATTDALDEAMGSALDQVQ